MRTRNPETLRVRGQILHGAYFAQSSASVTATAAATSGSKSARVDILQISLLILQ